jgi:putative flippase GtrA
MATGITIGVKMFVFNRFAIIGSIGFLTDASTFYFLSEHAYFVIDWARVIAFIIAMVVTWLGNRYFTFTAAKKAKVSVQFIKHTCCALVGFSINFLIFQSLISMDTNLAIAFIVGVLGAMVSNFFISKHVVFTQ